jgi:HEAT repeat protein
MKHFISIMAVATALVLSGATGSASTPAGALSAGSTALAHDLLAHDLPPASWAAADSADALWRGARDAFSDGEYDKAADLFKRIHERYPKSAYAGDSYYWEAAALYYSTGSSQAQLKRAVDLLQAQQAKYADARTVKSGESRTLTTRIRGLLAKNGDAASAATIATAASTASTARSTGKATRAAVAATASTVRSEAARASEARAEAREPRATRASEARVEAREPRAGTQSGCRSEEDDERVEALNALLQMNSDQAVPMLKKVLERRDACSEVLRRKAPFLLSQKRSEEVADILLATAKNDPDRETREQAVFWLSQTSGDKAIGVLVDILKTSNDEGLQNNALFALSQRNDARAQQAVRDYASRENAPQNVREQAVFWLGQRHSEDNAQFLKQLFAKTASDEAKQKVLFSLSQMSGFGNEQWILDQAVNAKNDMEVRKQALFWASQSGGVDVAKLGALYDRGQEYEFKKQVIFALSQKGRSPEAVDKLIDIARNEKDKELRKDAIFWLGQSRDPRAMKALQELIEK